jgi:hypothetical protein
MIEPAFANDILRGGDAIAEFLFGDRRKRLLVYEMVKRGKLPVFRPGGAGSTLVARKSTLRNYFAEVERAALRTGTAGDA